jgi:hypothetical protein
VSSASVFAWVTCEVLTPGTSVPYPTPRLPISNDLYVVYLPERTVVSDDVKIPRFTLLGHTFGPYVLANEHSCFDYDGYHTLSFGASSLFAYAVLATHCVLTDSVPFDSLTQVASHEIAESATDPVLTLGWIDDAYSLGAPTYDRLMKGEAGDICSDVGAMPSPPVKKGFPGIKKGTIVIPGASYSFVPYWSNSANACVAG